MTRIATDHDVITLINTFTTVPDNQQALVDILVEATKTVMCKMPGYVSANIHASLDGTRVVNYAQWQRRRDFEAMLAEPEARKHMRKASELAEHFEPHLYEVVFTDGG
jgi:antibiotic biosynthesis monooxygenase (ABM) superfamily enzyme